MLHLCFLHYRKIYNSVESAPRSQSALKFHLVFSHLEIITQHSVLLGSQLVQPIHQLSELHRPRLQLNVFERVNLL